MGKGYIILVILFIFSELSAQPVVTNDLPLNIGKSYRIYPSNVAQTEVFLVKSPLDQNIMFSACNTINFIPFFISEGIYTTINGGESWQGNDTCTGELIAFHGGDPGITIDKNGTFILTRLGRSPQYGLYSHYSLDNGKTWSYQNVISTDDLERATLITDAGSTSQFYGRSYAAWVKFALPYPLIFTFTGNGAQTWATPKQVNNPSHRSAGGDLAIGPNGEVYLCWAGVTDNSPFKEILVGFASSANGGTAWQITEHAFTVNGITGILSNKNNIRVNGLPLLAVDTTHGPRRGWIYIVTGQKDLLPAGSDPDIVMYRSVDGGLTWSQGIRVNQDNLNNGKTQYFPNIHIDKYGAVNIIFYDDRTTTSDSTGVFLARSSDGGSSWKEYEISDHHFEPVPIGGLGQGYQGDIIDLTSTDSKIWAVWMDNSTGTYQIWTVPIEFSSLEGVEDDGGRPGSTGLVQNYPNPFYSGTTIGYRVLSSGQVTLKVFDAFGVQIAGLVDEIKAPGYYEVSFTSVGSTTHSLIPGGIYIYQLRLNDRVETGRMVCVK